MAFMTFLALIVHFVVIQGKTVVGPDDALRAADSRVHFDVYASAISKAHYNPWFCNYFREPGYKCTDCNTALHCFPGNFALLIQCSGQMPYCSNGYCSSEKAERCNEKPSKIKSSVSDKHKLKETQNDTDGELVKPNDDIVTSTHTAQA